MSGIRTTEEFLAPDPSSPFSLVLSLKTSGKLGPSLHPKGADGGFSSLLPSSSASWDWSEQACCTSPSRDRRARSCWSPRGPFARSSPRSRGLERPHGFLGGLILAAAIFTNIVTNNGAGPSCFRLRCRSRRARDLPPALIVSIPLAASMAFSTPIGYQINLMVYGPGNYRFLDVARIGGLLQVLL